MAFYLPSLSGLNPVNSFPNYHGPYSVGTVDVEIPVADLPSPADAPEDAAATIAFRMFYPCVKPSSKEKQRPVRWIPSPQKATMNAYAKFLGANNKWATVISHMPQHLFWIKLPAHRNAQVLTPPTSNGRWPVMVFSHGLAGSRNAYSYICGDMASHGMVVIALDHRDGSSPIQYVRATATTEARIVPAVKISHEPSQQVYEARDKQLRIRLWEISVAFEALMKIDIGQRVENLDNNTSWSSKERSEVLQRFEGLLDVHRPGKVSWAGHSFGAASIFQLLKTIHYTNERPAEATNTLIIPKTDAAIVQQIMPESTTLLLDMWCLPLKSPDQNWLWEQPLPSYAHGGPKGDNVLSVLSESFWNWKDNANATEHAISGPQTSRRPSVVPRLTREKGHLLPSWAKLRDESPSSARDSGYASESSRSPAPNLRRQRSGVSKSESSSQGSTKSGAAFPPAAGERTKGPHMFYPPRSQHFNQSDFGVLFPWITRRLTKAEEPERILDLNARAMVQVMRENGIEVPGDDDSEILSKEEGALRRWIYCPVGESETQVENKAGLEKLNRRLSTSSGKGQAPRDEMAMGMETMDT